MKALFITHIRPTLEYCSVLWNTGFRGDLKLLESVQRRWTKLIDGMGNLPYNERLAQLDMFSVKGRLMRSDLIKMYKIFSGLSVILPEDLFILAPSVGTRGHPFKVSVVRTRLLCRERFFSVRVVNLWNGLPGHVVCSSSVDLFKRGVKDYLGDTLYEYVD